MERQFSGKDRLGGTDLMAIGHLRPYLRRRHQLAAEKIDLLNVFQPPFIKPLFLSL